MSFQDGERVPLPTSSQKASPKKCVTISLSICLFGLALVSAVQGRWGAPPRSAAASVGAVFGRLLPAASAPPTCGRRTAVVPARPRIPLRAVLGPRAPARRLGGAFASGAPRAGATWRLHGGARRGAAGEPRAATSLRMLGRRLRAHAPARRRRAGPPARAFLAARPAAAALWRISGRLTRCLRLRRRYLGEDFGKERAVAEERRERLAAAAARDAALQVIRLQLPPRACALLHAARFSRRAARAPAAD